MKRLLAVTFALAVAVSSAAANDARLSAPKLARASAVVTINGTGWACAGTVQLRAYVVGISPYEAVEIGSAKPDKRGHFSMKWTTPAVRDQLTWTIRGEQACGNDQPVVRYLEIDIGPPRSRVRAH